MRMDHDPAPGLYSRGSALDIGLKQSFDQSAANGCSEPT